MDEIQNIIIVWIRTLILRNFHTVRIISQTIKVVRRSLVTLTRAMHYLHTTTRSNLEMQYGGLEIV